MADEKNKPFFQRPGGFIAAVIIGLSPLVLIWAVSLALAWWQGGAVN